jgi:HSP20 family protein
MWQPFGDMLAMDTAIDQAMRNRQMERGRRASQGAAFPMDLSENNDGYTLAAVLPGVHPDNLNIDFAEGVLTIKAESIVEENSGEGVNYHIRERVGGTYERSLRFPVPLNSEAIEASYEHGILKLWLPKAESVKPRRIEVQAV